jgi:hypothetical protein
MSLLPETIYKAASRLAVVLISTFGLNTPDAMCRRILPSRCKRL